MRISNLGQVIILLKKAQVKEYQEGAKVIFDKGGNKNLFGVQIKYWL